MQVRPELQQAAVGVYDLGFGLFPDVLALFVFGKNPHRYTQQDALASPAVLLGLRLHFSSSLTLVYALCCRGRLSQQPGFSGFIAPAGKAAMQENGDFGMMES